jgi:hypothetical protein
MLVSLSSQVFDISGQVYINAAPDSDNVISRRVTRVATLDEGVAITDSGFSDGDRTINLSWRTVSREHNQLIENLIQNYGILIVSTVDGCFAAAPESFSPGPADSSMVLLVKERLSA